MAKIKVKELVQEWTTEFLKENKLELYNVEFIKEAGSWYLRVFIDIEGRPENQYISIEQCQVVSKFLSEILDKEDVISQNYFLEVSSPGLDRELVKEDDFVFYKGKHVDVNLYQKIDGKKEYTGELVEKNEKELIIIGGADEKIILPIEKVAKIKLAIK